ncbi:MAG TPA: hypothetical protein PLJ33_02055 [Peptococcaceae bacterium]|nr:hypothetical protein [Peptococcaceae bacterium]HPZ71744.1 hypothetical protein [Peptococcaceae bacterium]HQD53624.1 hypothetical protein [Peptococcaceae bacterium]
MLYCISKEGLGKSLLEEYHLQKQASSRFLIGQIILSDTVINSIKKTLKKVLPDAKITDDEISAVLFNEVLKREVLEGEKAKEAKRKINKALKATVKKAASKPASQEKNSETAKKQL